MRKTKRTRLEKKGWKVGTAQEFLDLEPEELALIEMKLHLGDSLRQRRQRRKLTQVQLAKLIRSSQSRVAKMEASDPSVSVDLLIRALLAAGASRKEIAGAIGKTSPRRYRRAATRGNSR